MFVRQISVFMENKAGMLGKITSVLKRENIDIRAFSIADQPEFGIFRIIVKDTERAVSVLRAEGMTAQTNRVIVTEICDKTGSFDSLVEPVCSRGIDIKYLYSFIGEKANCGRVVLCADNMELACEALKENGFVIFDEAEL